MKDTVFVSIITVCFNSEKTIRKTIESVLAQTYQNYEHIIVDGGSTDCTIEIVRSYEEQYKGRLVLHVGRDKGIYDAMNKGIKMAKGEVVGIINSDDWYDATALENVVQVFNERKSDLIVITGDLVRTTIDGEFLYLQKHDHNSISLRGLTQGMPLQHPAVFVASMVYDKIGCFDIGYKYLADYDFIWRCFDSKQVEFGFTHTTTSYMREGGASDTFKFKNIKERTQERYKLRKKYLGNCKAFVTSGKFFCTEIAKQSIKRILPRKLKERYYDKKHGMLRNESENGKKTGLVQKINDFLRDYPQIRSGIILVIRYAQYFVASSKRLLHGQKAGIYSTGKRLTPENENCYFGYYDKSPYSQNGQKIIYHSIPAMAAPKKGEAAKLYIQDCETGKREELGKTLAWNLQQGAMLRYYNDDTVAWNDFRDGKYCTVFHKFSNGEEHVLEEPLYDISRDGKLGLSLEFERLNVDAEGYGYIQQGITSFPTPAVIKIVDIAKEESRVIVDSSSLNRMYPIPHKTEFFYFNHLNFNPSGTRFLFIERYVYAHKRYSRLFSADTEGKELHLLADEVMVSHFTWVDDNHILVFCRHEGIDAYWQFEDREDHSFDRISQIGVDGHPTYSPVEKDSFISDTYPDHARLRHLFVYNRKTNEKKVLASLRAPIKYDGPVRCDFHPRFKPDGNSVCIDSIHEGYRGIYEIDLGE